MPVVATAGHVDHGKSRLVTALTGMEPDRLAEERRRGMTIDLGFAWCTLPSGTEVGFVDVPGHERFVRTMLAGVGPVRLVLFVVAADAGWSAQSEEHLAIVDVLGVDGAVVALTKRDLVDETELVRRTAEIRDRLAGTALAPAPVVAVSATTGAGIDDLRAALDAMVMGAPAAEDRGRARLAVDRVFTIAGAGTVVTGTLGDGVLSVGEEIEVAPGGTRARIRGLQTHGRSIDRAMPGARVAVNLAGVPTEALARGDALVAAGSRRPSDDLEVAIRPVRGGSEPPSRGAYSFHLGAADVAARVRVLGHDADGVAYARVRLGAAIAADPGDRFVLRDAGRGATVAGGEVLDVAPPRRAGSEAVARLARRRVARADARAALVVHDRGAVPARDLPALAGGSPAAGVLAAAGVIEAAGWCIAAPLLDDIRAALEAAVDVHHREHPLERGMPIAAVREHVGRRLRRARVAADPALVEALVEATVGSGVLERDAGFLRRAGHGAVGADDPELRRLVAAVSSATPPTIAELVADGIPRAAIDAAIREGLLVRIAPALVVSRAFVDGAIDAIRAAGSAGITVSELRERIGTSRKYAVPLVEHLDATRVTRREGDRRFARDAV